MINNVIFSYNRAAQLELLLRSFKKHFKEWDESNTTIIYRADAKEFQKGYEALKKIHPEFSYEPEKNFKQQAEAAISKKNQYTMFLVDDIIFKVDFSLKDPIFKLLKCNEHMLAVSLRLHKRINYCYAIDQEALPPIFSKYSKGEFLVWNWQGKLGDWGYGYSLDGNIYNTQYIQTILETTQYTNPNVMESVLNNPNFSYFDPKPVYMCCYDGPSKVINIPANKVQNVFENRCEDSLSANELNERFLSGQRIALEPIEQIRTNNMVHWPFQYEFEEK